MGPVVITAACTGLRLTDCVFLSWEQVHLEAGEIELRVHKTGEAVFIPLFKPLGDCLRNQPRAGPLCFSKAAKLFSEKSGELHSRLRKIIEKSGVEVPVAKATGIRLRKPTLVGFHAFKTSFITLALDAGVSIEILQKVVGNTTVGIVLEHYHQPSKDKIKAEFAAKMPAFFFGNNAPDTAVLIRKAAAQLEAMSR